MSRSGPILVLDADGVFLSERPYWNAALGTALDLAGLAEEGRGRWDSLADHAFGSLGLQRVTKGRGCNSNWDLAAVLVRALEHEDLRKVVGEMLASGREEDAMQALLFAGNLVWECGGEAGDDPLSGADIDRRGRFYAETVERFQQVFHGTAGLDWSFEPWQLRGDPERVRDAFDRLARRGFDLRVCTGRHRAEIEEPIRILGLGDWLRDEAIVSSDEVDLAESESGLVSLGKPHWFAPACAVAGYPAAFAALDGAPLASNGATTIYAGDAWADFRAVEGCRERGLDLHYIHVRSGVTTDEQERTIAAAPATVATVLTFDVIAELMA